MIPKEAQAKDDESLSDKIVNGLKFQEYDSYTWEHQDWIHKNDVKEFVKKLKEELNDNIMFNFIKDKDEFKRNEIIMMIDKIFGRELTK